ncbi:hypothetical protein [Pantoea vagans]|nr:hypothetical protein [Klebsiella quasipneumoniae subsp. quasipneumoniae]
MSTIEAPLTEAYSPLKPDVFYVFLRNEALFHSFPTKDRESDFGLTPP